MFRWRGSRAAVVMAATVAVVAAGLSAGVAAVPGDAASAWSDPAGDATGNPTISGSQPSKDLLSGHVCDDGSNLRFYLRLADLGAGTATARNGVAQSAWSARFTFGPNVRFIAAILTEGTTEPVYRMGKVIAGVEYHEFTSPNITNRPNGRFGSGPDGVVELSAPLLDVALVKGNVITGIQAVTIDGATGGMNPAASTVDVGPDTGGGTYTVGSAPCTTAPPPPDDPTDTTYFVSTAGSDTNDGLTLATPFRTIQRCADVAIAGNTCAIRGGTYRETVTPKNAGLDGSPITFAPYDGESVTVSGADEISGTWSRATAGDVPTAYAGSDFAQGVDNGHVWKTQVDPNPDLFAHQLFVDGEMMTQARWPNTGPNPSTPTNSTVGAINPSTDTGFESTPGAIYDPKLTHPPGFWIGATANVLVGTEYWMSSSTVSASAPSALTLSDTCGNNSCPTRGNPYFVTGILGALDAPAEWHYDDESRTLYFWAPTGSDPSALRVEAKQRNYGFDLSDRSYIDVERLRLFSTSVLTNQGSHHVVLDGLDVRYVSHYMTIPPTEQFQYHSQFVLDTGIILAGHDNVLRNSVITYSAGNGVSMQGRRNTVTNNVISETNYGAQFNAGIAMNSMGPALDASPNAEGSDQTVTHNTVFNTGSMGILWSSFAKGSSYYRRNNRIAYNDVFNANMQTQDGGSLYVCCDMRLDGSSVDHNWTHDLMAKVDRHRFNTYTGAGIYFDFGDDSVLVHHNVSWNNGGDGLRLNGANSENDSPRKFVYNNTLGGGQERSIGSFLALAMPETRIVNNIFRGPIETKDGAYVADNLPATVDPQFVDERRDDYRLTAASPAIDNGVVIEGVTDGFLGAAPDQGALEYGAEAFTPGCGLAACAITFVDDEVQGTGTNQWRYEGSGWNHCTVGCTPAAFPYHSTFSASATAGDTATIPFSGEGVAVHLTAGPDRGIAAISVDGGPEELVDTYLVKAAGDQLLWSDRGLSDGEHTLRIRVTGDRRSESTGASIAVDRVDVHPSATPPPPTTTVAVSLSPSTVTADGVSTSTATATVLDPSGLPVTTENVVFSTDGDVLFGNSTPTAKKTKKKSVAPAVVNNGDGTYTTTITASTTPGIELITATATGANVRGTASLSEQPIPTTTVTVGIEPATVPADGTSTAQAVAMVRDAAGAPVTDEQVVFSTDGDVVIGEVTNNGDGIYTATITASQTAGKERITAHATGAGVTGQATLTEIATAGYPNAYRYNPCGISDPRDRSPATLATPPFPGTPVPGGVWVTPEMVAYLDGRNMIAVDIENGKVEFTNIDNITYLTQARAGTDGVCVYWTNPSTDGATGGPIHLQAPQ